MQSNRVTKSVEGIEEAAACESGMSGPERKAYHTPELYELGGMKERTKGQNLFGSDFLVLGGDRDRS